jgi:hypothetical protein
VSGLATDGGTCAEDACGAITVVAFDCTGCPPPNSSGGSSCYGAPPPRVTHSLLG